MHLNTGVIRRSRQCRSKQACARPSGEGTESSLLESTGYQLPPTPISRLRLSPL